MRFSFLEKRDSHSLLFKRAELRLSGLEGLADKGLDSMTLPQLFYFCVCLLAALSRRADGKEQWMFQSEKKWDAQWRAGQWSYMDKVAVERSKIAVMGVMGQLYSNATGSVLDVGCGEGSLADFLTSEQQAQYVGVDLSKEAVLSGRRKRPKLRFVHSAAHHFKPRREGMRFDLIVFADMLYYVEYEKVMNQFDAYLNPNGIVIISIFHHSEELMYKNIFDAAGKIFDKVDEIEVAGTTKKQAHGAEVVVTKVAFHIETYRKKTNA